MWIHRVTTKHPNLKQEYPNCDVLCKVYYWLSKKSDHDHPVRVEQFYYNLYSIYVYVNTCTQKSVEALKTNPGSPRLATQYPT